MEFSKLLHQLQLLATPALQMSSSAMGANKLDFQTFGVNFFFFLLSARQTSLSLTNLRKSSPDKGDLLHELSSPRFSHLSLSVSRTALLLHAAIVYTGFYDSQVACSEGEVKEPKHHLDTRGPLITPSCPFCTLNISPPTEGDGVILFNAPFIHLGDIGVFV